MEARMILISGSTGHVGKDLVPLLLEQGQQVRVLVRDPGKLPEWKDRVEVAIGDLDKPESLASALRGIEKLYFVTPVTEQVANLVSAAKSTGVRYVIKQSTIEADRSLGPGKWHRQQEEMVKAGGFEWTFLRPTMFMSNTIEWWAGTIKAQSAVYFPGGEGHVPAVDSADLAAVAANVLCNEEHRGKVFEVTGPESHSIAEMIQIIAKVLGKPIKYVNVPAFLASIWLRTEGVSGELVKGLMETLNALRRNEYAYTTDVVEMIGGRRPRSFEKWVKENIESFRAKR
jgi:uncharacterized protein YbjT (DUF2867 family)